MALHQRFNRGYLHCVLIFSILVSVSACSFSYSNLEYRRGRKALEKTQYAQAQKHFNRVIQHNPDSEQALSAAREAAKIAMFETKQYGDAITFYQHLIRFSPYERERRDAQKTIASIFFEKLADYTRAIDEYSKLLLLRNSKDEIVEYRYYLARSHFYLNHFNEAQIEIESALKLADVSDNIFEMSMLLGNIYFNTKRLELAVATYEQLLKQFPERAKAENVEMTIVVCLEELDAFDAAISRLEKMRASYADKEFVDLKIKRLKERKSNMPGSKGLRK